LILNKTDRDREIVKNLEQIFSSLRHELANSTHALNINLTVLQDNYDRLDDIKRKHYVKRGLDILARQEIFIAAMESYSDFDVLENLEIHFLQFWESFLTKISGRVKSENIKLTRNNNIEPCRVLADESALHNALTNILDNAVEGLENQKNPEIELKTSRTNGHLLIQVRDNGMGISRENLEKIFIPFFTTKPGKMGMGLPIAHKLITKMDGEIKVQPLPEGGTEVNVWIKTAENPKTD